MSTTTDTTVRPLDFLVSEATGQRSRERVTLLAAQGALAAGTVLAKVTATGKYVPYDDDANGATAGVGIADAILAYNVPNSAADQTVTVIARDAEVHYEQLVWEASNDAGEKTAGLAELVAKGIIPRYS